MVLYHSYYYVKAAKLMSRIVTIKFFIQDIPQQIVIVAYLYAWYAPNGLRCQMCLFHTLSCDDEYPLHYTNLMVCIFTVLSACSGQMLLQAKQRPKTEEDELFLGCARFSMFSVSVLPFSTGILCLMSPLLHLRSPQVYFLTAVPTIVGWGTVLCAPFAMCEEM